MTIVQSKVQSLLKYLTFDWAKAVVFTSADETRRVVAAGISDAENVAVFDLFDASSWDEVVASPEFAAFKEAKMAAVLIVRPHPEREDKDVAFAGRIIHYELQALTPAERGTRLIRNGVPASVDMHFYRPDQTLDAKMLSWLNTRQFAWNAGMAPVPSPAEA